MTDQTQNTSNIDLTNFKKIHYIVEAGESNFPFYIIGIVLGITGLIAGIVHVIKHDNSGYFTIAISVIIGLVSASIGLSRSKDEPVNPVNLYTNARRRIMENGVMYIGVITDMNKQSIEGSDTGCNHTYIVEYYDADNQQKTTETYAVANFDWNAVGRRCTVYVHEGKVIVDAMEKRNGSMN